MSKVQFGYWTCLSQAARVGWEMGRQVFKTYRELSIKPGHKVGLRFAHDVNIVAPHMAGKDVVFVPTPESVVEAMVALAKLKDNDLAVDLGSGDGRLCIAACAAGACAEGYELNPKLVKRARENAEKAGFNSDMIEFYESDMLEADLSRYDVIFMYLLPYLNAKLEPKLKALRPGTRIVSHHFTMPNWIPDKVEVVEDGNIYLWVVK